MSSTFGGTAGGSGNRVVYIVTVDSSGVSQGLQTAEQAFNRFNTAAQSTARNLQSFDAPLGQLNTGFQGIGTGVDSASTSFNSLDNSLQTTSQNIKTTTTDLDAINSNWQQMGSGADSASNSVDALGNSFNAAKGGLTEYNTLSGTVVTNTQNMGDATQTMGDKMKSAGSFVKEHGLALALVTSSVVNLVSSYTQLQKSQLAADRASVMSEKANQRVVKAQDALNKAVEKFGPTSHEAQVKAKDFEIAQDAAGVAMRKAALALQTLAQQQASFVPQLIQDMVLIGGGTANMISGFKDGVQAIRGFAAALKTGLAPALLAAAGPVLVAVVGIYTLIGALTAAAKLNELVAQKMKAAGKDAVYMSVGEAKLIETKKALGLATKEEIAKLDKFNSQMENNVITSDEYKKVLEDSFNPIKMLDNITGQVTKSLDKFRTAQATATETTDEATVSNEEVAKASGIARMGIDETATSVDAYVGAVTKQIDAGDVLAKQQVDALAHIKPYTAEMLKLVDAENQGAQRIGELDKVQTQFNETLQTTKSGVTTTADIMKAVNDTLHMTSTNILTLDKEMNDLATKRAPEMAKAQQKAAQESQEAWKKFADEFNKNTDIISALGIDKKFDSDKIAKNLVKGLPNKLEKQMKLDLKFEEKSRKTEEGIQKFLQGVLDAKPTGGFKWDPNLKIDDKKASQIAKDLIKNIDKNTQDADLKQFREKLKAAVDRGASESEIARILADHVKNAPPIPVYVVDAPGTVNELNKTLETKIGPIPLKLVPQIQQQGKSWSALKDWLTGGSDNNVSDKLFLGDFQLNDPYSGKWNVNKDQTATREPGNVNKVQNMMHFLNQLSPEQTQQFMDYQSTHPKISPSSPDSGILRKIVGLGGGPNMVSGQVANMLSDFIKRYLGLQLQGDPKFPQLGFLWDDRSLLEPISDMQGKLKDGLTEFANNYITAFDNGMFKQIASTKPMVTPDVLKPFIVGANKILNAAMGPLAAGVLGAIGEETTNMFFGTQTIAQAKAQVQGGAANNKRIQQAERNAYSNISSGGIIGAKPTTAAGDPKLDVQARQYAQITKNINTLAQATVQLTKNNNIIAQTIAQITKNNNTYAKTIVTITKDINLWARATVTQIKDHNTLAKTIVTLTKDDNTYAKTIVQIIKDINLWARATVTQTKDNNQLAKTIVTVTKDINQAGRATRGWTKDLGGLEKQAKQTAAAIRSIPSGGGGGSRPSWDSVIHAQGGYHGTLSQDTLIMAHSGERVDIGRNNQGGGNSTVNQQINLHISGSDLINERNLSKRIKMTVGADRDKYG